MYTVLIDGVHDDCMMNGMLSRLFMDVDVDLVLDLDLVVVVVVVGLVIGASVAFVAFVVVVSRVRALALSLHCIGEQSKILSVFGILSLYKYCAYHFI